jgi:hypothetical protein
VVRNPHARLVLAVLGVGALLLLGLASVITFYLGLVLMVLWLVRRLRSWASWKRAAATKHPWPMRLSREEETFLRHWIYDEAHYQDGPGLAKRLQVRFQARPADLALLIAAAIPDPLEQERAALDRPSAELLGWPWGGEMLRERLAEARVALLSKSMNRASRSAAGPDRASLSSF